MGRARADQGGGDAEHAGGAKLGGFYRFHVVHLWGLAPIRVRRAGARRVRSWR
jgi:hypothetical protein